MKTAKRKVGVVTGSTLVAISTLASGDGFVDPSDSKPYFVISNVPGAVAGQVYAVDPATGSVNGGAPGTYQVYPDPNASYTPGI